MKIIRILKNITRRAQLKWKINRIYASDSKYQMRYMRGFCRDSKDKSDAEIMLIMHALEKGMSFPVKKMGYGKEKSLSLVELLIKHISKYGIDRQVVVATNILHSYISDSYSVSDVDVRNKIEDYLKAHNNLLSPMVGGAIVIKKPEGNPSYEDIKKFFDNRTSVRMYSDIPLTKEEIDRAIDIAKSSPSACNRQASRVYVVKNKQLMARVFDNQLGDQGWCNNADTLFVVTSISSYFGSLYERHEPYIDGGMFAMNLVMGLHAQGIASCFKMYIREPELDGIIRSLLSIPDNEIPIILILAGHYPIIEAKSPISLRNNISYEIK